MKNRKSTQRTAMKPSATALSQPFSTADQERAQKKAEVRAIMDELLRESELLEGRPLEDVIGGYGGRRSERRLTW